MSRAAADLAAERARVDELEEQLLAEKSAAEHLKGLCSSQAQACLHFFKRPHFCEAHATL